MTTPTTQIAGAKMTDEQDFHELAEPFWLKDSMKQGEFFDVNGFASALLASKPAVPEGFKLVPVEPTREMIDAGFKKGTGARHVYAAMLAASPTAPAQPCGEPDERSDYYEPRIAKCPLPQSYWTKEQVAAVREDADRLVAKLTPGALLDDAPAQHCGEPCSHDYVRSDKVCTECGELVQTDMERKALAAQSCGDAEQADSPQKLCSICHGHGRYQDGNSGTESDGYAPNIVECECAPEERFPRASEQADEAVTLPEAFKSPLTSFGLLVRALRIVAGTTLYDMAKALSSTPATLSAIECGRKPLTEEMVIDTYVFFTKLGVLDTLHALNAARAKDSK